MTFERKNHGAVRATMQSKPPFRKPEQTDYNLQSDPVFSKIISKDGKDTYHYKISSVKSPHRLKINYYVNIYYKSRRIDKSKGLANRRQK